MVHSNSFTGVGEWLARRAELTPAKVALVDIASGQRLSYTDLNHCARTLAAWFQSQGVQPGDRVAMLAANSPEYLDAFFACALIGAIFAPLNWRLTAAELATILRDCAPHLLLHDATQADAAQAALAKLQSTADIGPHGWGPWRRTNGNQPQPPRLIAVADFPKATAEAAPQPWRTSDGEALALILYTSGTTGAPKGAMLSHRMITWNAVNTQISWGLRDDDSTLTFAPFFHAGGLNVLTTPLYHLGGTVVLLGSSAPDIILRAVAQERCTILFAVPTVFQAILEHPDFAATDLSSLRFCVAGGSSCPLPVIHGYAARGLQFRQGYGLTEVGVNCFSLAPEDAVRKAGSVGKPVFHSRARIVDDADRDVMPGEVGELILAGQHICSGYWQQPEATADAFRDGWWHTGDQVRRDDEGYYYIVGRKKDMYISGGENVYPAEVEGVLATHPAIAEVAVIAQPDPKWGEVGVAIVVARTPGTLTAADVIAFCEGKLARYKWPKRVEFTDILPRNAMGKVNKNELRERFAAAVPAQQER
jgi:fatty-acyl-CoA synthase